MLICFSSQYERKKRCLKVSIEENLDNNENKKIHPPTPSPYIIDKDAITLFPDGEPLIENGLVDSESGDGSNDNQVG